LSLGLVEGTLQEVIDRELYQPWYMHRTSHWLGMDVHDVGAYALEKKPRPLEPGMVLTVEPGLYFAPSTAGTPEAYQGIGIRIEDDVLVTADGCEVLSHGVPKEREEILALRASAF
jgi:Xaa-Pro aminopeptidase